MKIFLAYLLYYLGDFVSRFLTITDGYVYPLYKKLMLWSCDLDTEGKIWKGNQERLIYNAWRDSEAYQVPMTEEGEKLAKQRYYSFKKGWEYAQFFAEHGNIYKKDHDEQL